MDLAALPARAATSWLGVDGDGDGDWRSELYSWLLAAQGGGGGGGQAKHAA